MARLPLISPLDRILFLKAQPYLAGQPPEVLTALASYTEERFHDSGDVVREGDRPVGEIFFLAEGALQTEVAVDGHRIGTRRIVAPGVVGIPHLAAEVCDAPAVVAEGETLLLALDANELDQIFDDHPSLLLNFILRTSEQALAAQRALGARRPDEPGFAAEDQFGTPVELDLVHRLARARRAPFFQGTNLTLLGQLIRFEDVERLPAGGSLWSVGDAIDRMSLVLDGELEAVGPFPSAVAPAGAVVGALEILDEIPREEGWVARESSRIVSIRRDTFVDLLEDHPEFAREHHAHCSRIVLAAWAEAVRTEIGPRSRTPERSTE